MRMLRRGLGHDVGDDSKLRHPLGRLMILAAGGGMTVSLWTSQSELNRESRNGTERNHRDPSRGSVMKSKEAGHSYRLPARHTSPDRYAPGCRQQCVGGSRHA